MDSGSKRVLHFIESGGLYGAEHVILNLSQKMFDQGEFHPIVGCIVSHQDEPSALYSEAVAQGFDALKILIPNARIPFAIPSAARVFRDNKIDLIHSHGYKPSVFGFLISRITGIPIVATCHLWFEMNRAPAKTRLMLWLETIVYRRFPRVIGVSDDIKKILVANGVPESHTQVIENGVDSPDVKLTSSEILALRSQLGIANNTFCILNAGRLTRQKGQWTLIEAAKLLNDSGLDFHMLIAGEGKLEGELKALIQENGLESKVTLLGFRSDIRNLLAVSDMLALPSLDEGMPMILLEATANKIPVVATAVGDIPKLISDQVSGIVIAKEDSRALAEAVEKLQGDPLFAKRMAEEAYDRMQSRYSSSSMYLQYRDVYHQLTANGRC